MVRTSSGAGYSESVLLSGTNLAVPRYEGHTVFANMMFVRYIRNSVPANPSSSIVSLAISCRVLSGKPSIPNALFFARRLRACRISAMSI